MSRDDDDSPTIASRVWALVSENWTLKLVSVLVSIALYVVLHSGGEKQRTMEVDLIRGADKDGSKVLLTAIPLRIHVTVQGPRSLLDDLPNPIDTISLDLSAQPTIVRLDDYALKLPPGVRKVGMNPSVLSLRWDTRVSKRVKVEVVKGPDPEGLIIKPGSISIVPNMVMLTGPKSRIDPVQKLSTASLDLKDRPLGSHMQALLVDKAAEGLVDGNVTVDPEQVEVRFELVAETKTRTFASIPVIALKGRVTLRPSNVSVIATCPPKRADELKVGDIVPKIDLEALGPDFAKKGPEDADVKVEVTGCSEVTVSPPRVTVSR